MNRPLLTALTVIALLSAVFLWVDSARDCDPVWAHEVSLSEWDALIDEGWKGDPRDGTDNVIYPLGCVEL